MSDEVDDFPEDVEFDIDSKAQAEKTRSIIASAIARRNNPEEEKSQNIRSERTSSGLIPGILTGGVVETEEGTPEKRRPLYPEKEKKSVVGSDLKTIAAISKGVKEFREERNQEPQVQHISDGKKRVVQITTDGTREGTYLLLNGKKVSFENLTLTVDKEKVLFRIAEVKTYQVFGD